MTIDEKDCQWILLAINHQEKLYTNNQIFA